MILTATANVGQVTAAIRAVFRDQIPYAQSVAVNQVLRKSQDAARGFMRHAFTIRDGRFADLNVKIPRGGFATKRHPEGEIRLENPGQVASKPYSLFSAFEGGGVRRITDRAKPLAVPSSNIRPSKGAKVPLALYPANLRLVPRRDASGGTLPAKSHVTKRGVVQLKGKRRTFVLDPATMFGVQTWGVYQRTGPKRGDIRLLWSFETAIPHPGVFPFTSIVLEVHDREYEAAFAEAFAKAVRTAR